MQMSWTCKDKDGGVPIAGATHDAQVRRRRLAFGLVLLEHMGKRECRTALAIVPNDVASLDAPIRARQCSCPLAEARQAQTRAARPRSEADDHVPAGSEKRGGLRQRCNSCS